MGIHPLALTRGLTREDIEETLENAVATIAIGNGPTMVLILGVDQDKRLIEASGVIRNEDVLFVHAAPAREAYQRLFDISQALPGAGAAPPATGDGEGEGGWGWSVDGLELTDALIAELREKANVGYDVDILKIRVRTGGPAPLSIGDTIRLDLDAGLWAATSARADGDGVAVHELIRRALRQRLQPVSAT
jgi:hypothetical protein